MKTEMAVAAWGDWRSACIVHENMCLLQWDQLSPELRIAWGRVVGAATERDQYREAQWAMGRCASLAARLAAVERQKESAMLRNRATHEKLVLAKQSIRRMKKRLNEL